MKLRNTGIIIFCIMIGIEITYILDQGVLVSWKQVPSPSDEIIRYFSMEEKTGYLEKIQACDYSTSEFSIISNYPRKIIDCVQVFVPYPEGEGRRTYIRDIGGNVWEWSIMNTIYNEIPNLCWPFVGLIIGVLIINERNYYEKLRDTSVS